MLEMFGSRESRDSYPPVNWPAGPGRVPSSVHLSSFIDPSEAEEMTRARYRAAKERILKMSIYDQKSVTEVQVMINQFFSLSGKRNYVATRVRLEFRIYLDFRVEYSGAE